MTDIEDKRIGEISSLSKSIILQSASNETFFNMTKNTLEALHQIFKTSVNLQQTRNTENPEIRNPLPVRTKGRTKIETQRFMSTAEKTEAQEAILAI